MPTVMSLEHKQVTLPGTQPEDWSGPVRFDRDTRQADVPQEVADALVTAYPTSVWIVGEEQKSSREPAPTPQKKKTEDDPNPEHEPVGVRAPDPEDQEDPKPKEKPTPKK